MPMLSSLVCPEWLESHPECPTYYFQHLYSWITFMCWTFMKQISRFAWGGLTRSSSVLKQKRHNCHLDSLSWLNKLAERLTGLKCSSTSHHRGKSLTLLFFPSVWAVRFHFCLPHCIWLSPQYPMGSDASMEQTHSVATGSCIAVAISCWFTCLSRCPLLFPKGRLPLQNGFSA